MEPSAYAVPLEELLASARVPREQQVSEVDTGVPHEQLPDLWPALKDAGG